MLDVRRLRLLRDLSLHGTVAATAAAAHLTAPAVSQQLAALEREAGLRLLEKHGRRLRLTAAGELLAAHAEVILGGLAAAEADLLAARGGIHSLVRVAAFPSAARALLPEVWRRLGEATPGKARMHLAEHEPDPALRALRRGDVDLAVVHAYSLLPRELPPGSQQQRLMDDPVLLAIAPARADLLGLSPGQAVNLCDFADDGWLLPGPETSCHELTRRACGAAGFVPHPVAVASDFTVLTALAAAGAGVALVPRLALPAGPHGASLHPLAQPVTRTISAVTRAGDASLPALREVVDCLAAIAAAIEAAGR